MNYSFWRSLLYYMVSKITQCSLFKLFLFKDQNMQNWVYNIFKYLNVYKEKFYFINLTDAVENKA